MHHLRVIIAQQPAIEINDTTDKFRRKDADAAIIEKIDPLAFAKDCVIAQMWIAMNDRELAEGMPPCAKHRCCNAIAHLLIACLEAQKLVAFEPIQHKQTTG